MNIEKLKQITSEHNKHLRIFEQNDQVPFHQLPENIMTRPEYDAKNKAYIEAVKDAKDYCDNFMSVIIDFNSKKHPGYLEIFYNQFGGSEAKLREQTEKSFIEQRKAYRPESQNTTYENSVLNNYAISTLEEQMYFSKFRDFIKSKWKAVGYLNDQQFISDFWEAHPPLKQNRQTVSSLSPA